ncbi:uncharacterized protein F5891DRAFT_973748 [Suillus fuscotomentosus]|uniref:Uncharacterized protein n=1 Tax=Suillus fuscotomentosus TaxID=1912939 RepID=A0AAD4HU20_9AGAM|nr:uncharacterized protein F5891DRAFT_973748 [Suillus fuscotomentosus]KAG1908306.1 hypothetical protein F5891DRAFT_973748 [Suillus fuscotomentosus]
MNSDLCTSPLSTRPEKTLGISAKETDSIFFDPSKSPNPRCAARRQFIHNRMMRKQHPYPVYPAPIEHIGYLENGLAQLRSSTLYKGYKAKLAARETARQRLVVTAWEIEESERFTAFLDALHSENEERLGFADEELQNFRRIFSERDRTEVDDDRDYLQAIYEDECEILHVTSAQAEQISKILGSRTKDAFLQSGPADSQSRFPSLEIHDDDDIVLDDSSDLDSEEECLGAPVGAGEAPDDVTSSTTICMPFQSRSGLNPSHVPADTQMCLSDEQPHEPMANIFNPHDGFSSSTRYDNYNSFSAHAPSGYVPSFHPAHTYDTHTVPRTDPAYQSNPNNNIPPYEPPVFDYESYRSFDGSYSPRRLEHLSDFDNMQAPNPHHIQIPQLFDHNEEEPLEPRDALVPVAMGEIPRSQVIHTTGPARSSNRRRRTRQLPGTPQFTHESPVVPATTQADVTATMHATPSHAGASGDNHYFQVTGPICDQIFKRSKELVVGIALTKDAMALSTADKKRIIKSIIRKATPKIPGLNGIPRWENQTKDLATIWRAVIVMRTAVTTLTREGVVMAYGLFPPQGSPISPETFRMDRVRHLIRNNVFMHDYSFNVDGTLTIHSKFKNHFILHLVTRMVWNMRFQLDILLVSPRRQLHFAMGLAGAITKCVLAEQAHLILTAPKSSPDADAFTFEMICSGMDDLTDEEKADLDGWKDHMVICHRDVSTAQE